MSRKRTTEVVTKMIDPNSPYIAPDLSKPLSPLSSPEHLSLFPRNPNSVSDSEFTQIQDTVIKLQLNAERLVVAMEDIAKTLGYIETTLEHRMR
jgi:hypothetical protein